MRTARGLQDRLKALHAIPLVGRRRTRRGGGRGEGGPYSGSDSDEPDQMTSSTSCLPHCRRSIRVQQRCLICLGKSVVGNGSQQQHPHPWKASKTSSGLDRQKLPLVHQSTIPEGHPDIETLVSSWIDHIHTFAFFRNYLAMLEMDTGIPVVVDVCQGAALFSQEGGHPAESLTETCLRSYSQNQPDSRALSAS